MQQAESSCRLSWSRLIYLALMSKLFVSCDALPPCAGDDIASWFMTRRTKKGKKKIVGQQQQQPRRCWVFEVDLAH